MERRVKERLVGAAVLMAAAIILIPEMLSGPRRERTAAAQTPTADAPMKTYTIDLNRSPGAPASPAEVDERAPPSETGSPSDAPSEQVAAASSENALSEAASTPPTQAIPESTEPQPRTPERVASEQAPARPAVEPRPAPVQAVPPPAREASAPTPVVNAPSIPTSRGWAVQLGSFASRATADRMVKDLAQKGQKAVVMPVKSGSNTLYRVRVGPFADRNTANDALRDVKGQVANAAVVAHP